MLRIDPDDTGVLEQDVARRLRLVRAALGMNQQDFGARAGLSQPQYHNFDKGKRLLTLEAALALCEEYSLTLDYLYRGDPSGLPYDLARTIRDIRLKRHNTPATRSQG